MVHAYVVFTYHDGRSLVYKRLMRGKDILSDAVDVLWHQTMALVSRVSILVPVVLLIDHNDLHLPPVDDHIRNKD